jgi:hypothetical protein
VGNRKVEYANASRNELGLEVGCGPPNITEPKVSSEGLQSIGTTSVVIVDVAGHQRTSYECSPTFAVAGKNGVGTPLLSLSMISRGLSRPVRVQHGRHPRQNLLDR